VHYQACLQELEDLLGQALLTAAPVDEETDTVETTTANVVTVAASETETKPTSRLQGPTEPQDDFPMDINDQAHQDDDQESTATPNREMSCPRDNRVLFWNWSFFCRDQVQIHPELSQSIERVTHSKSITFYSCNYVQYYVNPTLSAL
jgi:hypothetical protein